MQFRFFCKGFNALILSDYRVGLLIDCGLIFIWATQERERVRERNEKGSVRGIFIKEGKFFFLIFISLFQHFDPIRVASLYY